MKFCISLVITCFLIFDGVAQNREMIEYKSKYTYVYKLTEQDALDIHLKGKTKKPEKYLHTMADSVLTSQASKYEFKEGGYYFLVYTVDGSLKMQERIAGTIFPQLLHNGKDFQLLLYDQKGQEIKNAEVWFDQKKIRYDPEMNSYIQKNTIKNGLLQIKYNGEFLFRKIVVEKKKENYKYSFEHLFREPIRNWVEKRKDRRDLRGYLVTDKPMYRLNDTLHLKGVVYYKNKLLRRKLSLFLSYKKSTSYYASPTLIKLTTLKPDKNGNYLYQFKLADTLRIDHNYRIVLSDKDISLEKEFVLKDYRLEDYSFSVNSEKDDYNSGDTIRVRLTASDILGSPLPGAKAHVRIFCNSIKVVQDIQEYIPFKILDTTLYFIQGKTVVLQLPSTRMPYLAGHYKAKIKFTDGNNHINEEEIGWSYSNLKEKFVLTEIGDKAEIKFVRDGKSVPAKGILWEKNEKYFFQQEVHFPFSYVIDQYRTPLKVVYNNQDFQVEFERKQAPNFSFSQVHDTIRLNIVNEDSIKFWYQVLKGNKLLKSGYSSGISFSDLASRKKYRFRAEYFLNGSYYKISEKFPEFKEEYRIDTDFPATISPGDKVNLKVKIADSKNRPIKNMNLTAGAVDAKFSLNHVPMLNESMGEIPEGMQKDISANDNIAIDKWVDIQPEHRTLFHLDTVLFHKFVQPGRNGFYHYTKIKNEHGEVAPHVFIKGKKYWTYYILIDHKPVYYSHNNYSDQGTVAPYSIKTSEGYHSITIRTSDKIIEIDSVYVRNGYKLDFSVNASMKDQNRVRVQNKKEFLSKEELKILNKKIVTVRNYCKTPIFISTAHEEIKTEEGVSVVVFNNEPFVITRSGQRETIEADSTNWIEVHSTSIYKTGNSKSEKEIKNFLGSVPVYRLTQYPGEMTEDVRRPFAQKRSESILLNPYSIYADASTKSGNGTFFFQHPASFQFISYELKRHESPINFTYVLPLVYNVPAGKYSLLVWLDSMNCLLKDTVYIKEDTLTTVDVRSMIPIKQSGTPYRPWADKYYAIRQFGLQSYSNVNWEVRNNQNAVQNGSLPYAINYSQKYRYRGHFNRRYRYNGFGVGMTLSQWDNNNYGLTKSIMPSGYVYFFKRYTPRITMQIDLQYLNGISGYQNHTYHTHQLAASSFFSLDLLQHRGRYQKRPDFVPFIKTGFSAFMDMGTYYRMAGQKIYNPSVFFLQPMIPGGLGVRYKFSKQIDAELTALRYFNLLNFSFGQNRSVANFNQVRLSLAYIIPHRVICPKFRDGGMGTSKSRSSSPSEEGGVLMKGSLQLTEELVLVPKKNPDINYNSSPKIRSKLSDVGYWKPDLKTDWNGKAEFTVTFPEDITLWKTYLIGMGKNNKQFTTLSYLPSILPVSVKLNIPRFVLEGDEFSTYGNLSNFTGKPLQKVHYTLSSGNYLFQKDTSFIRTLTIPATMKVNSKDTMEITGKVLAGDNAGDAELQKLPVFHIGMLEAKGKDLMIYKDTTITIRMEKDMEGELQISNTTLDQMLNEVEYLRKYPYACMEQTASKLKGLLLLKSIYEKQQKKFDEDAEILKLIEKLEKGQKENGSWGWWPGTETDLYVSSYIVRILYKAVEMGYSSKSVAPATAFLKRFHQDEILSWDILVALSELSIPIDSSNLQRVVKSVSNLTDFQKLQRIRILQRNHYPFSIRELMNLKKETVYGGLYFGDDSYHWATNSTQASLLAYRILEEYKGYDKELERIVRYLFEAKEEGRWRNTVETAMVVDLILSTLKEKVNQAPIVRINNAEIKKFPYKGILQKDSSYSITYNASQPVYTSYHTVQWNAKPTKTGNVFYIETTFKKGNSKVGILKAGETYELEVQVKVDRSASYVMIEVPIPAGCLQAERTQRSWTETYRENFKEKTNIYLTTVSPGNYTFIVPVKATYPGNYTLNPAKISMMYFPARSGNEEVKKIVIE